MPEVKTEPIKSEVKPADLSEPHAEAEKLAPVDLIKVALKEYNVWLKNVIENGPDGVDGILKFVEILNRHLKNIKSEVPLAAVDLAEFNQSGNPDKFFQQFTPLKKLLEKNSFYFYIIPTATKLPQGEINYAAVQLGEIKSSKINTVNQRGKKATYKHIVLAEPPKGESGEDYRSLPAWFSAVTYSENGSMVVMQSEASYRDSAKILFDTLQAEPVTPKEFAVHAAFADYKDGDREKNLQAIKRLLMETSQIHEERHVLDGHLDDMKMTSKNVPKEVILEICGLLLPPLNY